MTKATTLICICTLSFVLFLIYFQYIIHHHSCCHFFTNIKSKLTFQAWIKDSFNNSFPVTQHPSIWTIGLLALNTRMSHCDYHKTTISKHMFWNEDLFQESLWVVDDTPDAIRIVESNYKHISPFSRFFIPSLSSSIMKSMQRIHAHTRMRSPKYEFQQWATFYLDVYSETYAKIHGIQSPDVLAIVDADAQFQTFPTFESIFPEYNYSIIVQKKQFNMKIVDSDFKLKAHGLTVKIFDEATYLLLNRSQVANFMVTFPVYVYASTLKNLRNYVSKLHNMTFDDAFEKVVTKSSTYYSQFCIILTYAYWFERDRYSFHIQIPTGSLFNKYLAKQSLQYKTNSKPPVRVMLHTKFQIVSAIEKGCCFSYQLNQSDSIDDPEIDENTKLKIKIKCNSFGSVESQYEMVCENMFTQNINERMIWKGNSTITEHYEHVHKAIQRLSKTSLQTKKHACIKFLIHPNPATWFSGKDSCLLP